MKFLLKIADGLNALKDLPALFFRLYLSYVFLGPFLFKWQNPEGFAQFLESIGTPMPLFFSWLILIFEGLGVLFLFFGFATRLITLPLLAIMITAIVTVHWAGGFEEFGPQLAYALMLFSLLITGPGKISVDALLTGRSRQQTS